MHWMLLLPVTLETNVIKLHEYLFPDQEYIPSKELKEYSSDLTYLSGFGEDDIPKRSADWDDVKKARLLGSGARPLPAAFFQRRER